MSTDAPSDEPQRANAIRGERRIHFERLGAGDAVVLVPGLGSGRRLFGTLPRRFARAGLHCVTFDPVGVPPSTELPADAVFSFDDAADDLLAVVDAVAPGGRAHLVGTSLGGKVALQAAARAPERVRSLCMLASSALPSARGRAVYRFFATIAGNLPAEAIGAAVGPFLVGRSFHEARPQVVADMLRAVRPTPSVQRLMVAQARALHDYDGRRAAESWSGPTLLVGGGEDTLTDLGDIRRTAALWPNARLAEIPDAGHSLLLESPRVFDEVLVFLREA